VGKQPSEPGLARFLSTPSRSIGVGIGALTPATTRWYLAPMQTFSSIEQAATALKGAVVTIGNFDGLHRGHRALITRTRDLARVRGVPSAILTFHPHPARLLAPHLAPPLISTPEQRRRLFAETEVDLLVEQPFDAAFAALSADSFTWLLLHTAGVSGIVVGHDFTFGRARGGNMATLQAAAERTGTTVEIIQPISVDGLVASSTKVREFVLSGNVEAAATLLGRPFRLEGPVVRGAGRGRTIGVPTANIAVQNELLPAMGVYAVRVTLPDGTVADGACNIGMNPTFRPEATEGLAARTLSVEVHLLDRSLDLYGAQLSLAFECRLRAERRFSSVDALVAQIKADIAETRQKLSQPAHNAQPA